MAITKRSKDQVDYGPGMKASHCGICRFFITPGGCEKVRGSILPKMWCRLFKKKV